MQEVSLRESVSLQSPVFWCDMDADEASIVGDTACASMVEGGEGRGDCGDMMGELQTV
jgi:hypothetical protein